MPVITDERLKELERAERMLNALEVGGVDNWDGYDFAMEEIWKENERLERLASIRDRIEEILAEGVHEPAGSVCGFGFAQRASDELFTYLKTLNIPLDVPPKEAK
jgi:hypothetical protein